MTLHHYFSLRILPINHFDRLFQPLILKLTDRFWSSQVTSTQSTEQYVLLGICATDLHVKKCAFHEFIGGLYSDVEYTGGFLKRTYREKQF